MKPIRNAGTDRVLDVIAPELKSGNKMDLMSSTGSLFAFNALSTVNRLGFSRHL